MTSIAEIMAPAGSFESLMGAIQGRADSIYFGAGNLNMRSRSSQNFSIEDLHRIASICKENGLKSYLTLNTVIFDNEMEQMQEMAQAAKAAGITAIIASDPSVIAYSSSIGMELHLSTQCNVTNTEAVRYYSRFADVIVLARELNVKQVKEITRRIYDDGIRGPKGELVQIEMFAHGALCMAVSGKCYLSLDNMNYSANRGACLQLCRRAYTVTDKDEGYQLDIDSEYIMSPKDLCTIGFLDRIIGAGVKVLKIEGRGRSADYVKTTANCYKEAVEAIADGSYSEEKIKRWTERLSSVYNRGFWDGYYLGQKMGEWTEKYGSRATKTKVYVGKVTNYFSKLNVAEIKMETHDIQSGDSIIIMGPTTGVVEMEVGEIRVDLNTVDKAVKGEYCSIPVTELVRRADKVYKLVDNIDN